MKQIKEEKTREIKETFTYYEALDGTRFTDSDECIKYEETARCVIKSKVMKLIVSKDNDAWELLGGVDDHLIVAFRMRDKEDVDNMKKFFLIEHPYYKDDERAELREKKFSIIDEAFKNKDLLLFGINCDDDYYFINSRLNIIHNLNDLDKPAFEDA